MNNSSDKKYRLDLNAASRKRSSWQCQAAGFENALQNLRNFQELPEDNTHHLINVSNGKYVYRCQDGEWDFAYKTIKGKTFWRYLCRPSLPLRETLHYNVLYDLQIPAPQVLALGDTRHNFILTESFIITAFLDGTHDGRIFMPGGKYRTGFEALRKAYCIENLKLLAKLHNAGYFHKASHPRNFLFRGDSPENIEIFWIDVARMRRMTRRRRSVIVDLHTFFRDMQLPRREVEELLNIYLPELKERIFADSDELLHELIHFKRRIFSKRKYKLFDND